MEKFCPQHNRELKEYTAGPNAKRPGSKYWKCTKLLSGKGVFPKEWCNYVEFENSFITTKKLTQLPNGEVLEEEAVWPTDAPESPKTGPNSEVEPKSDIRALLAEILTKVDAIRKFQLGDHE